MTDGLVSPRESSYPVVIMRSGGGALAVDYTTLAEDLASHGYIVIGVDAPYLTTIVLLPDGQTINSTSRKNPGDQPASKEKDFQLNKLVRICSEDNQFIVNKLEELNSYDPSGKFIGKLNLNSIGAFGHSFGGAITAQFCHDDPRCKAGVDIDGMVFGNVVKEGLHQPFMFLFGEHKGDPGSGKVLADVKSIYDQIPPNNRLWVTVHGAQHFNFTDQVFLKDSRITRMVGATGPIGGRRGLAVTSAYIYKFFNLFLKKIPDASIKKPMPDFAEVGYDLPKGQ